MSACSSLKPPLWTDLVWLKCQMNRRNAYLTITLINVANEGVWACAGFSAVQVHFDLEFSHPLWIQHGFHLSERHAQIPWALLPANFYKCSKGLRGIKARGPVGTSCETLEVRRHWPEWLTTVQCSRSSSIYSWAAMSSRFHTLSALETQRPFELWQPLEAQSWLVCSTSVRLSGMCVFGEVVDSCCTSWWDNRPGQEHRGRSLSGCTKSERRLTITTLSPYLAFWLFQAPWLIDRQSDPSSWDLLLIGIIDPNWS